MPRLPPPLQFPSRRLQGPGQAGRAIGRDGLQALTGRSLRVRVGFTLHCQPCRRARGKPTEYRTQRDRWPPCPFFCADFYLQFFRSNFFCPRMSKTRQRLCDGAGAGQLPKVRQADLVTPQILSLSRQPCQGWSVILLIALADGRSAAGANQTPPLPPGTLSHWHRAGKTSRAGT